MRGAVPSSSCGTNRRTSSTCASVDLVVERRRRLVVRERHLDLADDRARVGGPVGDLEERHAGLREPAQDRPRDRGAPAVPREQRRVHPEDAVARDADELVAARAATSRRRRSGPGRPRAPRATVSGELMSAVSISRAPSRSAISSNEHWPDRSGSIGPGSVTTAATSAPASAAAARQSRPITSKLTQTSRIARWILVRFRSYAGSTGSDGGTPFGRVGPSRRRAG